MEVLSIKKYNAKQTAKWQRDFDKVAEEARFGKRNWSELPQLAFYIFEKSYGYVAFEGSKALWAKTKKEVIDWWESEEIKKKVRGW
jgi:hypothetical protein